MDQWYEAELHCSPAAICLLWQLPLAAASSFLSALPMHLPVHFYLQELPLPFRVPETMHCTHPEECLCSKSCWSSIWVLSVLSHFKRSVIFDLEQGIVAVPVLLWTTADCSGSTHFIRLTHVGIFAMPVEHEYALRDVIKVELHWFACANKSTNDLIICTYIWKCLLRWHACRQGIMSAGHSCQNLPGDLGLPSKRLSLHLTSAPGWHYQHPASFTSHSYESTP